MKARLVAIGERAPDWVARGCAVYAKRLSRLMPFEIVELAPGRRGKGLDPVRAIASEGRRTLASVPKGAIAIALDGRGACWTSGQLAEQLSHWRNSGRDLAFLVGGPEGHAEEVRAAAGQCWSLGPLTLPHMLVRLVVLEQLYRAHSILDNHPYHRA